MRLTTQKLLLLWITFKV